MRLLELIEDLPDPRVQGKVKYNFGSLVFVTLCGILSGCESWSDISDYCVIKKDWLSKYVELPEDSPSEWTFRRVFTLLDPSFLEHLLKTHASEIVSSQKKSDQIAIDGKALRGSKREGISCLNSVSAWCHENGLVLGEEQVSEKSNEITAIPVLLEALDLKGTTVSIDAAGCQKSIVERIHEKKGHYVLGLKRNQKKLYEAVQALIVKKEITQERQLEDKFEDSHGRRVRRRYFGYNISHLPEIKGWCGAQTIVAVETISSRDNDPKQEVSAQWRYYLSSHKSDNDKLPAYIRHHWGIENKLHWVLDVHLKEDRDQKSERNSVRSFALLKRISLNILRTKDTTPKRGIRKKLKKAGWDQDYLLSILA